jgi:hypothetical protein
MFLESLRNLYDATPYSNILHDINGVAIPLAPEWRNIGISVSGGADSALLAYLVCKILSEQHYRSKVHIISNVRMWKLRPWQKYNSLDVYRWLRYRFPNIEFSRHENFIPPDFEWGTRGPTITDEYGELKSGDTIEIRSHAEYVVHNEKLDIYFNAVSRNPDVELKGEMPHRNIEPTLDNLSKMITVHMGCVSCHPFRFVRKDWIYQQYLTFDILDLYNITRSCEGDTEQYPTIFNGLNYETYTPGQFVPKCGQCFWCLERAWAEDSNNTK